MIIGERTEVAGRVGGAGECTQRRGCVVAIAEDVIAGGASAAVVAIVVLVTRRAASPTGRQLVGGREGTGAKTSGRPLRHTVAIVVAAEVFLQPTTKRTTTAHSAIGRGEGNGGSCGGRVTRLEQLVRVDAGLATGQARVTRAESQRTTTDASIDHHLAIVAPATSGNTVGQVLIMLLLL